jgi:hypothetical protein
VSETGIAAISAAAIPHFALYHKEFLNMDTNKW